MGPGWGPRGAKTSQALVDLAQILHNYSVELYKKSVNLIFQNLIPNYLKTTHLLAKLCIFKVLSSSNDIIKLNEIWNT